MQLRETPASDFSHVHLCFGLKNMMRVNHFFLQIEGAQFLDPMPSWSRNVISIYILKVS